MIYLDSRDSKDRYHKIEIGNPEEQNSKKNPSYRN